MANKLQITSMITGGKPVEFDAYLTDISQTFASTWNSTDVFGRNDPIATFANTKRTISVSFEVPAGSLKHAKENLENVGKLTQFMYPGYNTITRGVEETQQNNGSGPPQTVTKQQKLSQFVSRPPLVKIKFANLIDSYIGGEKPVKNKQEEETKPVPKTNAGLLGFIGSLSINPVLEAGMFRDNGNLYPRTITISFDFTVLHQTNVGWQVDGKGIISWMPGSKKIPFM